MTNQEFVLKTLEHCGAMLAEHVQSRLSDLTGTQLYAVAEYIPTFSGALKKCNMCSRRAGFICKSPGGRLVKLLQPYDSDIYTEEPEKLPAQWGIQWSQNPVHALPFVAVVSSPYQQGDCCTENGKVYRSGINGNLRAPGEDPRNWTQVSSDKNENP